MTLIYKRNTRDFLATLLVIAFMIPAGFADENRANSLSAIELRALKAQALEAQVADLQQRMEEMTQKLEKAESKVLELEQQHKDLQAQNEKLEADLANRGLEIQKRDRLLQLFRSGNFEYYQVQEGDTVETIAANPMVYGKAENASWIAQVNSLSPSAPLAPGTVLIIPRYTEGFSYDF